MIMSQKKFRLKCNCSAKIEVEGYATDIQKYVEKKEGYKDRDVLKFTVSSINTNEQDICYTTPWGCVLHKNRAVEVGKWLKDMQLVIVEGIPRQEKNTHSTSIQVVHVRSGNPKMAEVIMEVKEDIDEAK